MHGPGKFGTPKALSYHFLKEITDGFSDDRKLGSGAYGEVYMGIYEDGRMIAVKVLRGMPAVNNEQQFLNEFKNLASLQHQNIVQLVGYCYETKNKFTDCIGDFAGTMRRVLCFEYLPNGSLARHLSDEQAGLPWYTRFTIIKGICMGLKYLHQELDSPMLHLDLKPENVLLDENMVPKIADFGLSRFFAEQKTHITENFKGTLGYLPPEYINGNKISIKSDIFSLGVVIIKITAGPKCYFNYANAEECRRFSDLVYGNWRERLQETLTGALLESYSKQVKTCIKIALRCVKENREERPSIGEVVDAINDTETNSDLPQFPQALGKELERSMDQMIHGEEDLPSTDVNPAEQSPRQFDYSVLKEATGNFSFERKLGYGEVYKATFMRDLDDHKNDDVAVKVCNDYGRDDYSTQINVLSMVEHKNIVRFIGWCHGTETELVDSYFLTVDQLLLVYELVPNGDLQKHLDLPWPTRYKIVKGIASALCYLHHEFEPPILHGYINPTNILLDNHFNPKLAKIGDFKREDFIVSEDLWLRLNESMNRSRYEDDLSFGEEFDCSCDVYSFGMVLLEIACGQNKSRDEISRKYISNGCAAVEDIADEKLAGKFDREQMELVIRLGLLCSQSDRQERPSMQEVMKKILERGGHADPLPMMTEAGPRFGYWVSKFLNSLKYRFIAHN